MNFRAPTRPVLALALCGSVGVALLSPVEPAAQHQPPQRVSGPQISSLIRNTIVAVDQANKTGNYTVLRDLGSLSFHNLRSAANLAEIFRPLRQARIDMSGTVLHDPKMSEEPKLTTGGVLQLKGWFPTRPDNITFDLTYRFEDDAWRIMSISIGLQPHGENNAAGARRSNNGPGKSQASQNNGQKEN